MTTDTALHKLMCGALMSTPLALTCAPSKYFVVDKSVDDGVDCLCAPHKENRNMRGRRCLRPAR